MTNIDLKNNTEPKGILYYLGDPLFLTELGNCLDGTDLTVKKVVSVVRAQTKTNPNLLKCTPASVLGAVLRCAQLGLEPGGDAGQAYLIPYKDKCQLQIGYKGLIHIAYRSGGIVSLQADTVYDTDKFEYEHGTTPYLRHTRPFGGRNDAKGAYAIAKNANGAYQFVVMDKDEIETIRKQSQTGGAIWSKHWDEMAKKTVIKRLIKTLPPCTALSKAVDLDNRVEAQKSQNNEDIFDGESSVVLKDFVKESEDFYEVEDQDRVTMVDLLGDH